MNLIRRVQPFSLGALQVALVVSLTGCHESSTRLRNLVKDRSTVSVHLWSDPSEAFREVNIHITRVEARMQAKGGGDWKVLSKPDRTLDLQTLGVLGGKGEDLVSNLELEKEGFGQVRLGVDPARSTVRLADGSLHPLLLPEPFASGIPVKVAAAARDNHIQNLDLDVDVARSIQTGRKEDGSLSYTFRPVMRLTDRSATGSMRGRLVDDHKAPLVGVRVLAQEGEEGSRVLVRTVLTGSDGTYRVDRLALGHMYYLVAQPRSGERVFAAQASEGFAPNRAEKVQEYDFPPFEPAEEAPGPEGALPGPVSAQDYAGVELRQHLTTGTRRGVFIIQTALGTAAPDGGSSTYRFAPVAAGPYEVLHLHTVVDKDGFAIPTLRERQDVELKGKAEALKVDFPKPK